MLLLSLVFSQAFAQTPSIAVLDVACADTDPICETIISAVRNQVQIQLAGIDISPVSRGQMTSMLAAQSIEPQCDIGSCELSVAQMIGAKWIINGKLEQSTNVYQLTLFEAQNAKPLVETSLKAVNDEKISARVASAVSTLLSLVVPDTSYEIGELFANVPTMVAGEGRLRIETDPPGIAFILDGNKRITTPFQANLNAGVHHLAIDDPCHWSKETRFLLSNGESLVKTIPIIQKTANLNVKIKDADSKNPAHRARLLIDDKQLGHSPFRQPISVCSKELVLRTPTRFWSQKLDLKDGQYETHWISLKDMDVVVEESDGKMKWGCTEKYTVAALATLGGGLTLGAVARSPVLASVALASGPVYFFGRWACEAKSTGVESSEKSSEKKPVEPSDKSLQP